jgi:hypothetical protein
MNCAYYIPNKWIGQKRHLNGRLFGFTFNLTFLEIICLGGTKSQLAPLCWIANLFISDKRLSVT